jgi:hypothetical protein
LYGTSGVLVLRGCRSGVKRIGIHMVERIARNMFLHSSLFRMDVSKIVLNRGLRQAVLAAAAAQGLSMSEIAVRCGRVKHDSKGKESGETSWLARRLGIAPEGGESTPTPWIHSDVLALIALLLGVQGRRLSPNVLSRTFRHYVSAAGVNEHKRASHPTR